MVIWWAGFWRAFGMQQAYQQLCFAEIAVRIDFLTEQ
jgi:hypothetical protein